MLTTFGGLLMGLRLPLQRRSSVVGAAAFADQTRMHGRDHSALALANAPVTDLEASRVHRRLPMLQSLYRRMSAELSWLARSAKAETVDTT